MEKLLVAGSWVLLVGSVGLWGLATLETVEALPEGAGGRRLRGRILVAILSSAGLLIWNTAQSGGISATETGGWCCLGGMVVAGIMLLAHGCLRRSGSALLVGVVVLMATVIGR